MTKKAKYATPESGEIEYGRLHVKRMAFLA